jgi:hypothetical protein
MPTIGADFRQPEARLSRDKILIFPNHLFLLWRMFLSFNARFGQEEYVKLAACILDSRGRLKRSCNFSHVLCGTLQEDTTSTIGALKVEYDVTPGTLNLASSESIEHGFSFQAQWLFLGALQNCPDVQSFPQARRSFENLFEASTPEMLINHCCMVSSSFENSPVRAGAHRIFLCRFLSTASFQDIW